MAKRNKEKEMAKRNKEKEEAKPPAPAPCAHAPSDAGARFKSLLGNSERVLF